MYTPQTNLSDIGKQGFMLLVISLSLAFISFFGIKINLHVNDTNSLKAECPPFVLPKPPPAPSLPKPTDEEINDKAKLNAILLDYISRYNDYTRNRNVATNNAYMEYQRCLSGSESNAK